MAIKKSIFHGLKGAMRMLAALLCIGIGQAQGQWSFLGNQYISDTAVSSHALVFDDDWHAHAAFVSGGMVILKTYDGSQWQSESTTGLPSIGVESCAMAISDNGETYLALGPQLVVYQRDSSGWLPISAFPPMGPARNPLLRIAPNGKLWVSCYTTGAGDTTFAFSHLPNSNWVSAGIQNGRVRDMELDDFGKPVLLLEDATALLQYSGNGWLPLPAFSTPSEDYFAFQMSYDGTGTGAMVMRRDSANGITVELLSLGNWLQLGTAGFTTGDEADIGLSHSGVPHVVSVERANGGPPRAYQYVAGNWQFLGGQFVYNNTVSLPQLAFDQSAAYVIFRDEEADLRSSVMYLGTPSHAAAPTASQMQLWPNPCPRLLQIDLPSDIRSANVDVYNSMGNSVKQATLVAGKPCVLDVDDLIPGQYFLVVTPLHRLPLTGSFLKID